MHQVTISPARALRLSGEAPGVFPAKHLAVTHEPIRTATTPGFLRGPLVQDEARLWEPLDASSRMSEELGPALREFLMGVRGPVLERVSPDARSRPRSTHLEGS